MTSGLNFGGLASENVNSLELLSRFLSGNHLNPQWNLLSSRIQRLIICGDSINEHSKANEV